MLKIDRNAFLALALGMNLGACYTSPSPQPTMGNQTRPMPGPVSETAYAAPHNECVAWTPTGECNKWQASAPHNECVGWTPTGECNKWDTAVAPQNECVAWTPTGECSKWEPRHE
jgi:hypothetical protein